MTLGGGLFAVGFGAPALLWGLGLASAPIIIHLLSRRRYREMSWAAMQWLLAAIKQNARRIRIEQIILLAVRTLLVLLVVLAMTKPYLEAAIARIQGRRTHHVIVLDGSYSMGYRLTDRDRFDRAKEVAAAIVRDASPGDAASLILMAAPPRIVVGESSTNLRAIESELAALRMPHGRADLSATLEKVEEVLRSSSLSRAEVYFITDLQRSSWDAGSAPSAGYVERVARIGRAAHAVVIDLGQTRSDNVAITDLEFVSPFITAGSDQTVTATLRNFGRDNLAGLHVELLVDGDVKERRATDLPGASTGTVSFSTSIGEPGPHWIEARVDDDRLNVDNRRTLAIVVKEAIDVLCIDGEPSGEPFASEADYLRFALAPQPRGAAELSALRPEIMRESEFLEAELARYDCLLFANIAQFTDNEYRLLERYLERGGSIAWFLGDQVDAEAYNRVLFRDGKGILPARLGAKVGDPQSRVAAFRFNPLDYRHPVTRPFRGAEQGGLLTTLTYAYLRAEVAADSDAETALAYHTGDAAIVTMPARRGQVALVTTSADTEWTNWPFWPSYVPVVQELVATLVADRDRHRTVMVGQPLVVAAPEVAVEMPVTIEVPSGEVVSRRFRSDSSQRGFHFDETSTSGRYRLRVGPPLLLDLPYAANVDTRESDLRRLERDEFQTLLPGLRLTFLTNWQSMDERQSVMTGARGELHRGLLAAALLLLFVESFLAWKFSHYTVSTLA